MSSPKPMRKLIDEAINGLRPQLEDVSKIKVQAVVRRLVEEAVRRAAQKFDDDLYVWEGQRAGKSYVESLVAAVMGKDGGE